MKVAVVGASGFIGLRLVEMLHLGGGFTIIPVVRSFSSLAVLARFELDWKVCDPLQTESLADSFSGCQAVVHAAIGNPLQIVEMAKSIYLAAEQAGVRRLVVLSSASVHGQSPEAGTDERSPLYTNHSLDYNNAKVKAELELQRLQKKGGVELILLRPGVVFGPRSRWISVLAGQIQANAAYLINNGKGICNAIYVDNLVEAIRLSLLSSAGHQEAFLVGDAETVRWIDFYRPLLDTFDKPLESVHRLEPPEFRRSFREKLEGIVATRPVQAALPLFPDRLKHLVKAVLAAWEPVMPHNSWQIKKTIHAPVTEEMALLQQCSWKLPHDKAEKVLNYQPVVSFEEGMRRSISWLEFIGMPVGNLSSHVSLEN